MMNFSQQKLIRHSEIGVRTTHSTFFNILLDDLFSMGLRKKPSPRGMHMIFSLLLKYLDKQKQLSRACYLKSVTTVARVKNRNNKQWTRRLHEIQLGEKEQISQMHVLHNWFSYFLYVDWKGLEWTRYQMTCMHIFSLHIYSHHSSVIKIGFDFS